MRELLNIKYWLFDLDNTLYSGDTKVFDQVDKRMSKYISNKLKVSIEEARKIQKNYFHEYNTTLNGMIKNHEIDAKEFLDFVHDIDLEFLEPQYCIFIEDIARNLKPAHELGMKTVWIKNNEPWAAKYSDEKFVNYKTSNLTNFLKEINELREN